MEQYQFDVLYPEPEPEFESVKYKEQFEKEAAEIQALQAEYYSIFPDDPLVIFDSDEGSPPHEEYVALWKWAIEHKQHWYDCPLLPKSCYKSSYSYSMLNLFQQKRSRICSRLT